MIKFILIVATVVLSGFVIHAQDGVQLARVQFQYLFPSEGQWKESTFKGAFTLPIPLSKNMALIVGYRPEKLDWEYSSLSQHMLQLGFNREFSADRSLQVLALWRRNRTSFENSSPTDQWGGWILYKWRASSGVKWGVGTYANRERFGWLVVPLVYLDWKLSDKWRIYGNLPINARFGYKASDRFSTGLAFFGLASSYDDIGGTYIERRSNELTLFGEYQIWRGVFVDLRAGMALGRSYGRFLSGDEMDMSLSLIRIGDNRASIFETNEAVPILEVGLSYRLMR